MLYCCTKFQKICSSLSRSKRCANFHIFSKISFVHVQFMYLLNLHTTPKGHLIKIGTFLQKTILIEKNIRSHDVLNGLNSIKFLEILNSNKTPNIFCTYQLKIIFKPLNFVRKPFLMCFKIRTPLGLKHLNFRIFPFILHRKYPSNVY